jgi:hypothetical protein
MFHSSNEPFRSQAGADKIPRTNREFEATVQSEQRRTERPFISDAGVFNLDFRGTSFTVPKLSLFNLFEHHRDLFDATSYEVQSSVPVGVFEIFVAALETGTKVVVTKENAGAISLLATEFWLADLLSECSALQAASNPELIATLSQRISKLEHEMSSQPLAIIAGLKESTLNHDRQLKSLDYRISRLEPKLAMAQTDVRPRHGHPTKPQTDLTELESGWPAPVLTVSDSKLLKEVDFPLTAAESVNGLIAYLTRKHGGNVHDKGMVIITSKSVYSEAPGHAVRNVAALTSISAFFSKNEPGQWVCWDFREMRVRPTHYTVTRLALKSWVFESSLDFMNWTEIDRKTDNEDFTHWETATFAVSNSADSDRQETS